MRTIHWLGRASLLAGLLALAAGTTAQDAKKDEKTDKEAKKAEDREPDCVWVGSPPEVVEKMLEVANLTEKDILHDLGCGDGRVLVAAAKKYKCKAFGCDIDPDRVRASEDAKGKESKDVQERIAIKKADLFLTDFSDATVVTLYLLPDMNEKLIPKFEKLAAGSRVVSHYFEIPGVVPDKGYPIVVKTKEGHECDVFLYTTPLKFDEDRKKDKGAKKDKDEKKDK